MGRKSKFVRFDIFKISSPGLHTLMKLYERGEMVSHKELGLNEEHIRYLKLARYGLVDLYVCATELFMSRYRPRKPFMQELKQERYIKFNPNEDRGVTRQMMYALKSKGYVYYAYKLTEYGKRLVEKYLRGCTTKEIPNYAPRKTINRVNRELYKKIVQSSKAGMSIPAIADEYGLSKYYIYDLLYRTPLKFED